MKIKLKEIPIKELTEGYSDCAEEGVFGYGGKLNIRPPYQREFIYKDKQRAAVIDTITKNFPLNVMYWAVTEDGYEIVDGQQRTISVCQYINGDFSYKGKYFHNLTEEEKEQILNYKVMVYFCSGTDKEKLAWFETINISGEKLTAQELRNAVYYGPWVTDAKKYFSKTGGPAYSIGSNYLTGTAIRQDYLEKVIKWASTDIDEYMAKNHKETSASDLWLYFKSIISWVETTFLKYRKEMKGLPWGEIYNEFKEKKLDPKILEIEISELMVDEEVENKKGIYQYVLDKQEKHLNLRSFSNNQKRELYEKQEGVCSLCNEHFEIEEMEADHITPWSEGGKTNIENCQMLCRECNRRKSDK